MRLKLLSLSLLFNITACFAQSSIFGLKVWFNEQEPIVFALDQNPKVTFDDQEVAITATNVEVRYSLSSLTHFTYEVYTGVDDVLDKDNEILVKCSSELLVIDNCKENSELTIYDSKGATVYSANLCKGENSISISNIQHGMYIVNVNNYSFKILR